MNLKKFKSMLVFLWNKVVDIKIYLTNMCHKIKDIFLRLIKKNPNIKSIDDTLTEIIDKQSSVSRYGDGEVKLINNIDITFQKADPILTKRLKEILLTDESNFLVCLPDVFRDLSVYDDEPKQYWSVHTAKYRLKWYRLLNKEKQYYNSFISRFYYPFKEKEKSYGWLMKLKEIWNERDIVIIEGKKSRLGVGNDLFNNVKSLERILVAEENAFYHYEKIINEVKKINKSKLILIAAGPTATVLAYDLYKAGYQAIDIGHVDIEYEWFLRKVKSKTSIKNKYVCEAGAGKGVGEINNEKYLNEIRASIY